MSGWVEASRTLLNPGPLPGKHLGVTWVKAGDLSVHGCYRRRRMTNETGCRRPEAGGVGNGVQLWSGVGPTGLAKEVSQERAHAV